MLTISSTDDLTTKNNEHELEDLQKRHNDQISRIQELKTILPSMKLCLENIKKESAEEKLETFRNLSREYLAMRDEYNALVAYQGNQNR
ncbi:hypothetical protein AQUCO_01400719v1 [Aquilegia coerulea]|uniref:Uncharacterized protein n=1 Tax=Aquilegia coerulea TaxID=218851 RepID=A0A2G5DXU4_AQUCA|nr:hypothetical protein AQUCO_01400719v1 [Aquilegia coerulea]